MVWDGSVYEIGLFAILYVFNHLFYQYELMNDHFMLRLESSTAFFCVQIIDIFQVNLTAPNGARTYSPDIKSCTLY